MDLPVTNVKLIGTNAGTHRVFTEVPVSTLLDATTAFVAQVLQVKYLRIPSIELDCLDYI